MTTSLWQLTLMQCWQIAAVAVVVAVAAWMLGNRRPHLAHVLWMLVLAKALTPPLWSSEWSPFSRLQSDRPPVVRTAALPPTTVVESSPVRQATADPPVEPLLSTTTIADDPPPRTFDWQVLAVAFWLSGIVVSAAAIAILYARWWRAVLNSTLPTDASLQDDFRQLARDVGLHAAPRLIVSRLPTGPVAGGILQPTVILPASLAQLPFHELRPLLAHELVHLRRRDPLAAVVQWTAVAIWWWHPAVWLASRAVTRERERCCDAEVLGTLQFDPHAYAQCLINALRERIVRQRRPVPLTMPLTSPTGRRLEHIMHGKDFLPRPPKRNLLIAIALALIVLPGAPLLTTGATQATAEQPSPQPASPAPVAANPDPQAPQAPQLLYLTWQKGDEGSGKPVPHTLWKPDGSLVPDAEAAQVLADVGSFLFHWKAADELRPLVLVFRSPTSQQLYSVQPIAISSDGVRSSGRTWQSNEGKSLCPSVVAFRKNELEQWPDSISLELVYPVEDEQVIRTVTEIPDEPIEIAEGVTWYLDPHYAVEVDRVTGQSRPITGRTTAVLRTAPDLDPLVRYSATVLQKADNALAKPASEAGATNIEIAGATFGIRYTQPFSPDQMDRVEFRRRRYARSTIDNVRLRLDLLAQVWGDAEPADAVAVEQFDDDYALPNNVSVRRIAPPYPASRMAYYRIKQAEQAKHIPDGPGNMLFRWNGTRLRIGQSWFDERGSELRRLLPAIVGIGPDRLQGDRRLLDLHLPGDFVVRDQGTPMNDRVADMQQILSAALQQPIALKLQQRSVDAYVARGKFELSAAAKERGIVLIEGALRGSANSVEDAITNAKSAPRPKLDDFLEKSLSELIGLPVINEVEVPYEERVYYQSVLGPDVLTNFDPAPLIKSVSEQTGLTFTREQRELLTLTVEKGK